MSIEREKIERLQDNLSLILRLHSEKRAATKRFDSIKAKWGFAAIIAAVILINHLTGNSAIIKAIGELGVAAAFIVVATFPVLYFSQRKKLREVEEQFSKSATPLYEINAYLKVDERRPDITATIKVINSSQEWTIEEFMSL